MEILKAPKSWDLSNGTISNQESYFGTQSLSVSGSLQQEQSVSQFVDLSQFLDSTDSSMYTISAHVKTDVVASSDFEPPIVECNSDDFDEELDPIYGSGAQIRVTCCQQGTRVRVLQMPFFESHCNAFIERKTSFLVPSGTDGLLVELVVVDSNMTAFFDNVRLTAKDVAINRRHFFPDSIGSDASVVEAPEPQTYVAVENGSSDAEFDSAFSSVSDFDNDEYGKIVWVPNGEYLVKRIIPARRSHLKMHQRTRLRRDPTNAGGFRGVILRSDQNQQYNRISDVIVEGGTYLQAPDTGEPTNDNRGTIVSLYGDRIVLTNFKIPEWSQTVSLDNRR